MGEMLLNGRLYGASGIRELTQAQYDALPASKLTDGILYCIKDTGIVEGEKFAPVIYSLEEREIGVWTDGKPLYQKTVHINALPSTTYSTQTYPHNIANIDQIIDYNAIIRWSTTNKQVAKITRLGLFSDTDYQRNFIGCITIEATKDNILVVVGTDRSSMSADVTLQYTKTTDVPGSGTWGTDGVPMVHYDGNEKVIGTWFGETLYEKSFQFENYVAIPATSWTTIMNVSSLSISKLVRCDFLDMEGVYWSGALNRISNGNLQTYVFEAWSIKELTLQYTKTN